MVRGVGQSVFLRDSIRMAVADREIKMIAVAQRVSKTSVLLLCVTDTPQLDGRCARRS